MLRCCGALQWGHRLSAMETITERVAYLAAVHASMGPPPFGDGNVAVVVAPDASSRSLQWGHRLSAMETAPPRSARRPASPSFNGATAFRRWKLVLTRRLQLQSRRFNGATAFRRWKPASVAATSGPPHGFNGATAFRRWKPLNGRATDRSISKLQWGHRLSAMETVERQGHRPEHQQASMGPPPFGDGNANVRPRHASRSGASMGPPPFGDGNCGIQRAGVEVLVASMGPPPFGDGNFRASLRSTMQSAKLQWGHRLSAMETDHWATPLISFCSLQWGHRLSAMETAGSSQHLCLCFGASMGPPPFGDGNSGTRDRGWKPSSSFNGATAFRRWKLGHPVDAPCVVFVLQWGHRLSAMETPSRPPAMRQRVSCFNGATAFRRWKPQAALVLHPEVPASMGPPPFGDGNERVNVHVPRQDAASMGTPPFGDGNFKRSRDAPASLVGASMGPPPFGDGNRSMEDWRRSDHPVLQWGHRLSAMETSCAFWRCPASMPRFNGATAFRRWKHHIKSPPSRSCTGFNGATAFRRWKRLRLRVHNAVVSVASMGPPPFGDGNVTMPRPFAPSRISLQWGHRLSAMETRPDGVGRAARWAGFNGATAFRRWKLGHADVGEPEAVLASMGPPPFGDGNLERQHVLDGGKPASMGPPPFGDGNLPG